MACIPRNEPQLRQAHCQVGVPAGAPGSTRLSTRVHTLNSPTSSNPLATPVVTASRASGWHASAVIAPRWGSCTLVLSAKVPPGADALDSASQKLSAWPRSVDAASTGGRDSTVMSVDASWLKAASETRGSARTPVAPARMQNFHF